MSKAIYLFLLGLAFLTPAVAQTKQELAMELAKVAVDNQFKELKPLLDGNLDNLKRQAQESGKLDRVFEIFIDETKGSINRESFILILAGHWADKLTQTELLQALEMVHSPLYKKVNEVTASIGQPQTIAPIFNEACNRTRVRAQAASLSTRDLDLICKRFVP